ncbi:citrate lyase ligase [Enterococcus ratti]|uniref:[Citrate [pro-3S]-lyase] ligase n=1 Tax=Enterococcus ratti TaxID=150033 RepID=A0A1L8WSI6_9ENTE|nr:citrate lyase ligase [Enterococcus ratti]
MQVFNQTDIRQLFLKNHFVREQWQRLLVHSGIKPATKAFQQLDKTLGLYQGEELVGTVSYQKNVIKYIAISEKYKQSGHTLHVLVSAIIQEMSQHEIFHYFVFTKQRYQKSFEHLGFKTIVSTEKTAILEMGDWSIAQYLATIPKTLNAKNAAIVMNANPFTNGHSYLIEQAAAANDWVYVFVLEKEQALFSTLERFRFVQEGVKHLKNVIVVLGNDYVISPATFPTYFLRENDEAAKEQMIVDATLFKERIAASLNITTRYVGEEPFSPMTSTYNQVLKKILPPEITVKVIPRKKTQQNQVISASQVRKAFLEEQLEDIQEMVSKTTYHYLKNKRES